MAFEALGRCLYAQVSQFTELTQPWWDLSEIAVIQVQNLHHKVLWRVGFLALARLRYE